MTASLPEALIDNLVVSGTEDAVAERLKDLLENQLDELNLSIVPVQDEAQEQSRLMEVIAGL